MAQPVDVAVLRITITRISGEVLLGPRAIFDGSESVKELKQKLPHCDGGVWQLLLEGRELLDTERLADTCNTSMENEVTAVAVKTAGTELMQLTATAKERNARLKQESEQWLSTYMSVDEDARRQRRDQDIQIYQQAVTILLQQIEDFAIADCRREAVNGKSCCHVHLEDLQRYELGKQFYFTRAKPIRADPVLRGWYFSTHEEALDPHDVPAAMELKRPMFLADGTLNQQTRPCHSHVFIRMLARELVQRFEQQGLQVSPGSSFGALELNWGTEDSAVRSRHENWYDAPPVPTAQVDGRVRKVRRRPSAQS
ncbi:unnamed protein product [Prorocentrum cordatum]|uniref:Ubiquitin-like domain-containing protein n=1 Tax=Prorocentrum cordatum TaxID=2364126 RepID=A0ABN9UEE5_9DINO|nr:unnamed protein product [Polarella glacialis]